MAPPRAKPGDRSEATIRSLRRLKWLTVLAPAAAVFLFETVRHGLVDQFLVTWAGPAIPGNLVAGLLACGLTLVFSTVVFGRVERLQCRAVAQGRVLVAVTARAAERERLSRDLHDGMAQTIAAVLVRLDTVAALVAAERRADALGELERLRAAADDLYADVREAITGLSTQVAERGFEAALRDYLAAYEERHGLPVEARIAAPAPVVAPAAGMELFRLVQEALTNVRRHAGAGRAWVSWAMPAPGLVELEVGDDGRGFDAVSSGPGHGMHGLKTMRERAEGLGGTLRVERRLGGGTRVVATVPLARLRAEEADDALATVAR